MSIHEANREFQFDKVHLIQPVHSQNGNYFTKINYQGAPLYIQTPQCKSKQGFVQTNKGKKIYIDLMFDNTQTEFIEWLENLEATLQNILYQKRDEWFTGDLEKSDIENAFTSTVRIYKSGAFYLVRTNVNTRLALPSIKIFNENEMPIPMEEIHHDTNILSILEFQGIKFSMRNFQIDIEIKQVMVVNDHPIFEQCMIRKHNSSSSSNATAIEKVALEEKKEEPFTVDPATQGVSSYPVSENVGNFSSETKSLPSESLKDVSGNHSFEIYPSTNVKEDTPENITIHITEQNHRQGSSTEDLESSSENNDSFYDSDGNDDDDSLEERVPRIKIEDSENLVLEIDDDLCSKEEDLVDTEDDEIKEVDILENLGDEKVHIKPPNEIYYKLYKEAKSKAKEAKRNALVAYLEAKEIKKTYMLDDSDSDSDSSDEPTFESISSSSFSHPV